MYCEGTGRILCGMCLGEAGGCNTCTDRRGTVLCINCQGSGMAVPEELMQILGDAEVPGELRRPEKTLSVLQFGDKVCMPRTLNTTKE